MALRQNPGAIRHMQLKATDITTATVRLCVKPRCSAFPRNKSRSGALASSISTPRGGRYWRQCAVNRVLKRPLAARKVQNPAKLCAIGDAIGKSVNALPHARSKGRRLVLCTGGSLARHSQKFVVNALDLLTNLPPVEVGQDRGARAGSEFRCQRRIFKEGENSLAECLAIVIRHNVGVVQMAHPLGAAGEGNNRPACQHVVEELDGMTRAFGSRNDRDIG